MSTTTLLCPLLHYYVHYILYNYSCNIHENNYIFSVTKRNNINMAPNISANMGAIVPIHNILVTILVYYLFTYFHYSYPQQHNHISPLLYPLTSTTTTTSRCELPAFTRCIVPVSSWRRRKGYPSAWSVSSPRPGRTAAPQIAGTFFRKPDKSPQQI